MNVETQSLIPKNSGLYQKLVWLWKAISLCDFLILLEILVSYISDAFFDILLAMDTSMLRNGLSFDSLSFLLRSLTSSSVSAVFLSVL